MKNLSILLLCAVFVLPLNFFAQNEEEEQTGCHQATSKKAIALYEKAKDKKKYKDKKERMEFLNKALSIDSEYVEAKFALAQEMLTLWKLEKMDFGAIKPLFKAVIKDCPDFHSDPYYYIGYDYYDNGRNDSAKKYLLAYLNFTNHDDAKFAKDYEQMKYNATLMLAQIEIDLKKEGKKVPFDPKVVTPISSPVDEFLCYISPDDSTFYFTRRQPYKAKGMIHEVEQWQEIFMYAKRNKDGNWAEPEAMYYPFNQKANEGGPTLTLNNKRLYYTIFTDDGAGMNADIYYRDFFDGEWTKPEKVKNINDPLAWDSQPSISPDGNTLFFASDRQGGLGEIDIYIARRDAVTGQFGKPLNLGPVINTQGREKCPFIHPDGETLYFCSDGRVDGYGGLDIYFSKQDEKTLTFKKPENLGYPINSPEDDAGLIVSTDGSFGYFFAEPSDRTKGVGKFDVYAFELYEEAQPSEVTFLRGTVLDVDGNKMRGAKVEIINPEGTVKVQAVVDSMSGEYIAALNKKYFKEKAVVAPKKEDYAFTATIVKVKDNTFKDPPKDVTLEMQEMKLNERIVMNEIHYKTNSAELDPRSYIMLNEFAIWLNDNPNVKVEIGGHTDTVGSSSSNQVLSTDRAYTVKAYLEERGVDGKRINAKGYGDSLPIQDNKTAEGRALNRRTEFKVLSK